MVVWGYRSRVEGTHHHLFGRCSTRNPFEGGGYMGALVSSFEEPKEYERLAWALDSVDEDAPVTKSALFDSVLADRINRGREALKGKKVVVEKERENAQKDLDAADVWSEDSKKTRDALQVPYILG